MVVVAAAADAVVIVVAGVAAGVVVVDAVGGVVVVAVGVVAKHDKKWGETPCAFVELREGSKVTSDELKIHCKNILAGFKVPSEFQFIEIPKTSTGKIQKFKLRELIK